MKKLLFTLFSAVALAFSQSSAGTIPLASGNTLQGLAGTASAVTYTIFGTVTGAAGSPNYQVLAQGQLGTSNAVLFTVPYASTALVTLVSMSNSTATAVSGVSLAVNGTAATSTFQVLSSVTIPANGSLVYHSQGLAIRDVNGNLPTASVLCGSSVAASAAIAATETQVVACTMAANTMAAGTTFRITAAGKTTAVSGGQVFKVRVGTTTLTGTIAATVTPTANAVTAQSFWLEFLVTVRTAGTAGTVVGQGVLHGTDVTTGAWTTLNIIGITTSSVAVDTTAAKVVELTAITGNADTTITFQNAAIQVVRL